jgi:hypothetical protein
MSFALFSSTTFIFSLLIDNKFSDQETLTKARDILMENAGINIEVEAIAYIRGVRLDLNRNLTDAKSKIKENATNNKVFQLLNIIN